MKRTIKNPHWTNNARTVMSAEFHYDDGRVVTAVINCNDENNPDWIEIKSKYSSEELESNTLKVIKKQQQQQQLERQHQKAMEEKKRQEELFAIKLQAFETDAVKNTTNRVLKSSIRRAKSVFEVYAYTAALILDEQKNKQETTTEEVK
jgi:UDP-3-O-[3-hydroxymyristoyl] glucosamine N-acyltransferase